MAYNTMQMLLKAGATVAPIFSNVGVNMSNECLNVNVVNSCGITSGNIHNSINLLPEAFVLSPLFTPYVKCSQCNVELN